MKLQTSVEATIGYYNLIGLALTEVEVWRRLISPARFGIDISSEVSLHDLRLELKRLVEGGLVVVQDGYFALSKYGDTIKRRVAIINELDKKWGVYVRRRLRIFSYIPFTRAVYVSGSLAVGNVSRRSDIDVLVVIAPGKLWFVRGLTTSLLSILKIRRNGSRVENRICLNHFLVDTKLLVAHQSTYNAQTYINLIPVYIHQSYVGNANMVRLSKWLQEYVVVDEKRFHMQDSRTIKQSKIADYLQKAVEWLLQPGGRCLEAFSRYIQLRKIKKHPLTGKKGGRIVASSHELEFHPESKELRVLQSYNELLKTLEIDRLVVERDSGLR